ncbi:hypothetical protein Cylst_4045 [Cylindrospermum stagnale PCC 7417]|uniref:Uncharacterized protein n=1 Tax=Cylindrospermum stagnale PCC 7417 TaxID=56107 RepID=K9X0L5_9NOST|nr:hypothetical protein [Cylindrospermum stagnale]AFZ26155.1 hypothetical protein Cylst_4045 [Cylindrospermum stagnale PCC 7417]
MRNLRGGGIIALTTILCLSITSLAIAQTPARKTRNSPILPYLLDNPHDNSTVRVRCLPRDRQETDRQRRIIRDSLLQPTPSYPPNTVTIEIEGSCRNVRVRVQGDSDFLDSPIYQPSEFDDDWLNRQGSGWYWHRNGR